MNLYTNRKLKRRASNYYGASMLRLWLFLFITYPNWIIGQAVAENTPEYCQELIRQGTYAATHGNKAKGLEYFFKAEALADKFHWEDKLIVSRNNIGLTYLFLSNYGEALGYFNSSLQIAQQAGMEKHLAAVYNNIGLVYSREKDNRTAIEYWQKSYKAATVDRESLVAAINLADALTKIGKYKESRSYLREVENLPKDKVYEQMWEVNLAENYFLEGNVNEAQKRMENLIGQLDLKDRNNCYVCIAELLSKVYSRLKKEKEAIAFAETGLQNATEMPDRINLYNQLSALYFQLGDYKTGFKYKDSVIQAKDSMSVLINRGLFESNKVKLNVQKFQDELKANKENRAAERQLYLIVTIFFLVFFYMIYKVLKNQIRQQKQEKTIAENKKVIVDLELESLKNNVAEKNRKLSSKALYLSGRNEIIEEIINSLSHIQDVAKNPEIMNYIRTLKSHLKTDEEWDDFITYFEQVNPDFFRVLKEKHPQLSAQDIRFLCYIYMNMDIKEISSIFSITLEAGRKRKQRIAKKMDVAVDDLHEYILKINHDHN